MVRPQPTEKQPRQGTASSPDSSPVPKPDGNTMAESRPRSSRRASNGSRGGESTPVADGPILRSHLDQIIAEVKDVKREIRNDVKDAKREIQGQVKGVEREIRAEVKGVKREVRKSEASLSTQIASDLDNLKTQVEDNKKDIDKHAKRIQELENIIKKNGNQDNEIQDLVDQPTDDPAAPEDPNVSNDIELPAGEEEDHVPPLLPPQQVPTSPGVLPAVEPEPEPVAEELGTRRQRRAAKDSKAKTKKDIQQGRRKFTPAFREKATKRVEKLMKENKSLQEAVSEALYRYHHKDIGRPNLQRWVKTEAKSNPNGALAQLLAADALKQKKKK